MTFTAAMAPRADRFRPRDIWAGPDGKLYSVANLRSLPQHVCLRPLRGGAHALIRRDSVLGFRRTKWGGVD